jgi:rare lipoprotein A
VPRQNVALKRAVVFTCAVIFFLGAAAATAQHRTFKGEAIYYSNEFKGETMACGGAYQPWKMVAAHRKLACGTRLKVKNRANGKIVTVRVKDRGPYGDSDTVLDLSRKAARKLDFISAGRARIRAWVRHD